MCGVRADLSMDVYARIRDRVPDQCEGYPSGGGREIEVRCDRRSRRERERGFAELRGRIPRAAVHVQPDGPGPLRYTFQQVARIVGPRRDRSRFEQIE